MTLPTDKLTHYNLVEPCNACPGCKGNELAKHMLCFEEGVNYSAEWVSMQQQYIWTTPHKLTIPTCPWLGLPASEIPWSMAFRSYMVSEIE